MKIQFIRNLLVIMLADIAIITTSLFLGYAVRYDFNLNPQILTQLKQILPFIILLKLIVIYYCGLYRGMWRYTSTSDLINIVKAVTSSTLIISFGILHWNRFQGFARSVFIIDWCFSILLIASFRFGVRLYFENNNGDTKLINRIFSLLTIFKKDFSTAKQLLIIGAGDSGEKIYREIRDNAGLKYKVVGFLDDQNVKIGMRIHGIPVLGSIDELSYVTKTLGIEELLIAIPSATAIEMRRIIDYCEESGLPFKTIPSMGELINGRLSVSSIREVSYNDLLGREKVHLDEKSIGEYINGKIVLVTGAAGSIGSELCRQICKFKPKILILFERAESPLYEIDMELRGKYPNINIFPRLADIQDLTDIENIFTEFSPQIVFHAAAYKHVPMLEHQAWKAVKNNILGTSNVAENSLKYGVEKFVLVSTDKAVRPTNIMGTSKRIAEILIQKLSIENRNKTKFMIVRFGNVVGSSGSVLPLFKKQIAQGGPVTVTHREITRFFMTIPEASQLILQAGSMGEGGEIFILDMGTPIKIANIARDMIKLSGFEPETDIKIKYVGLRPGEKLYEELITEGEGIVPTNHKKIMVLRADAQKLECIENYRQRMVKLADHEDGVRIMKLFKTIVPEYTPPVDYQEMENKIRLCN